ncbi:DNA cytosine methyltransferase [Agrobacterium cavarae]
MEFSVSQKKKSDQPDWTKDAYVVEARKKIKSLRSLETKYYLKIAEEIASLQAHVDETATTSEVDAWLKSEVGLGAVEVKTFLRFDQDLTRSLALVQNGVSPNVIAAIAQADERTRTQCLTQIERGEPVDLEWIKLRTRNNLLADMPADELAMLRRTEVLHQACEAYAADQRAEIERGAAELLDVVAAAGADRESLEAVYSFSPTGEVDRNLPANKLAGKILSNVDAIFGGRPRVYDRPTDANPMSYQPSSGHVALASFHFSYNALHEVHNGKVSPADLISDQWLKPRRCLEFLAGRRASAVPDRTAQGLRWSPPTMPAFVDIDAGAGGTALGLVAAGMHPVLVLVRTEHELSVMSKHPVLVLSRSEHEQTAATLSPVPNVHLQGVDFMTRLQSLQGREIDLLTSGMPWHSYKPADARKAYQNALNALAILKPKAFLFETLPWKDDGYKAADFGGYDVRWYTLDSADYGLVQAKKREVVVGARKGEDLLNRLAMPVLPHRPQVLASAIRDLVAGHVWRGDESVEERMAHRVLVQQWLEKCGADPAPRLPNPFQKRTAPAWRRLGIDISKFVRNSPTVDDLRREGGFFLSTEMVKRIQGYPVEWDVEAALYSLAPTVANSFPPVMAKMVGLSLNTAMTGVEFDHERAFKVPLLRTRPSRLWPGERIIYAPALSESYADPNRAFKIREGERLRRSDVPRPA